MEEYKTGMILLMLVMIQMKKAIVIMPRFVKKDNLVGMKLKYFFNDF